MSEVSMQSQQPVHIEDDEIDLRELWKTIFKWKIMIVAVTIVMTILSIIYAYSITPIYQAKGIVELAQIEKEPVQNLIDLQQKLEMIFKVNAKGKDIEYPIVSSIELPRKTKNILIIQTQGYDNASTEKKIQEFVSYIQASQDKELESYIKTKKQKLYLVNQDIERNEKQIADIEKRMSGYEDKLMSVSKKDAALGGIYVIELGRQQAELNELKAKVYDLKSEKNDIGLSVSPLKIQRAKLVGEVEVLDYPIKPKKKQIVIVAFAAGLILSLFLAFLLEFIINVKNEETQQS